MIRTFDLPCMDSQKSFYGKAIVSTVGNDKYLTSYKTVVCGIVNGEFVKYWDNYSNTTMKHINSFRLFYGLNKIRKQEWDNMECVYEVNPIMDGEQKYKTMMLKQNGYYRYNLG